MGRAGLEGWRSIARVLRGVSLEKHEGDQRASIIPYLRWDRTDDERSLADLQEAYWAFEGDDYEVLVGANTVFWGVTESVHLVDIINQTDAVADIDGEDKLGQPMVNVEMQRDWGLLSLYVMPYFRERTFAGVDGRFRPPLPVDADNALMSPAMQKITSISRCVTATTLVMSISGSAHSAAPAASHDWYCRTTVRYLFRTTT